MAQLQVMLHGWFPQSCIFQGLTSSSQGLPGRMRFLLQSFGLHCQNPFSEWTPSISGVCYHEKICGRGIPISSGATQECDCCESGVCAAQLVRHSYRQARALLRHHSRKDRAWANGFHSVQTWNKLFQFWTIEVFCFWNMSETTVSGPCSSLKFSVIWLPDLIVDKGMILRRCPEVELPGPVAMQELKGKSLEGEGTNPF